MIMQTLRDTMTLAPKKSLFCNLLLGTKIYNLSSSIVNFYYLDYCIYYLWSSIFFKKDNFTFFPSFFITFKSKRHKKKSNDNNDYVDLQ